MLKKRLLKNAAAVALLTLGSTAALGLFPTRSQALIGVSTGNVGLLIIGGGMLVGGVTATYGGIDAQMNPDAWVGKVLSKTQMTNPGEDLLVIPGSLSVLAGIVILDAQGQITPHFSALTPTSAQALGISADEMGAYNSELPQVNAIYQTIYEAIVSDSETQPQSSAQELAHFADQEWSAYAPALSPETQSALAQVRENLARTVDQAAASKQ